MKAIFSRISRICRRINDKQEGITGLETAIILIAFVMVASVLAYVVLEAGMYSAQKAKLAVHSGLESTTSVIQLKGDVIGKMTNNTLQELYLFVGIPGAGSPVDFGGTSNSTQQVVISYSDIDTMIPLLSWTITKLSTINDDNLLDKNELFMLTVDMSASDNIGAYDEFALEVRPPGGPALNIERTIPARTTQYVNLH
ncbi:MAG: hypothetical protein Q8O05_08050 [Chloroflexota bacterium]|nr:hypothetical protein [Chloroflexota bacterium]